MTDPRWPPAKFWKQSVKKSRDPLQRIEIHISTYKNHSYFPVRHSNIFFTVSALPSLNHCVGLESFTQQTLFNISNICVISYYNLPSLEVINEHFINITDIDHSK